MKDHRRLIADCAAFMKATVYTVFFCSLAYELTDKSEIRLASDEAAFILDRFEETGIVPDFIEVFCLGVLLGKIPIYEANGKALPTRKKAV